jgi:DNA helicase-2/ATP-dependent DNA helicase PcrA
MPDALDFAAELNEEQCAAATAPDGPQLVLAAAGTGKTRTLVYRLAYLVHQGVDRSRILLLTFTNKAAREMLERANELVGPSATRPWSGTFHHVANRFLRQYADRLGFRRDYVIMDRDDGRTLMRGCLRDLKLDSKEFPRRDVLLGLLSESANTQRTMEWVAERRFAETETPVEDVLRVLELYCDRKRALDGMDFDDLLLNALLLLKENPDILERFQEQFRYVLVDEYQDTNPVQAELVDLLAAKHRNLFVVGDDFQCIYSWRGADFRNIMTFAERYPDATIYKLETNYRSVPEVLAVANAVVDGSDVSETFRKELRATREAYERPREMILRDGEHQARFVAEQIQRFRREGYRHRDIAVLYRAHFHSMELQMALTRSHVPHNITSGIRFFEQAHVKDVLCLLRVVGSAEDELAFQRLICLLPGVGEKTGAKLWAKLGGQFRATDPVSRVALREAIPARGRERWAPVDELLGEIEEEGLVSSMGEIVKRFVDVFYRTYAVDSFENADERLEDINELTTECGKFEKLEEFLSDVALQSNLDAETDEEGAAADAVRLSTIHQAKGLEWPVVIVLWCSEKMFPSPKALDEDELGDGEAEERRLFYVAVTRACDELLLCAPSVRRMRDGGVMFCERSRFLDELSADVIQSHRVGYI